MGSISLCGKCNISALLAQASRSHCQNASCWITSSSGSRIDIFVGHSWPFFMESDRRIWNWCYRATISRKWRSAVRPTWVQHPEGIVQEEKSVTTPERRTTSQTAQKERWAESGRIVVRRNCDWECFCDIHCFLCWCCTGFTRRHRDKSFSRFFYDLWPI